MRLFYWLKLVQACVAISLLIRILSTSQLCSVLVFTKTLEPRLINESCKQLIREMESVGLHSFSIRNDNAIRASESDVPINKTRLGIFFTDVLRSWDRLWGSGNYSTTLSTSPIVSPTLPSLSPVEVVDVVVTSDALASTASIPGATDKLETMSPKMTQYTVVNVEIPSESPPAVQIKPETGFKQCLKVSFDDFFGFGPYRSNTNKVLRLFSAPVFCILNYLVIVFMHVFLHKVGPYGKCGVILVLVCGFSWVFVLLSMLTIDYNWNRVWMLNGSFTPEVMDAVADAKVVSLLMFLCNLFEAIFNEHLAKHVRLQRVTNYYEVNDRSSAGCEVNRECLLSGEEWMDIHGERSEALSSVVVPSY